MRLRIVLRIFFLVLNDNFWSSFKQFKKIYKSDGVGLIKSIEILDDFFSERLYPP